MAATTLATIKVGSNHPLTCRLLSTLGAALTIDDARVTIVRVGSQEIVVSHAQAEVFDGNRARYVWTPELSGDYVIEWHIVHGGGTDKFAKDAFIHVDPKWTIPFISAAQSATIGQITQVSAGGAVLTATQAVTVGAVSQVAEASSIVSASQAAEVGAISQAAAATVQVSGSQAATVGAIAQVATANVVFVGVIDDMIAAGGSAPRFAGSVSHRLYSAYTGPLCRIARVNDDAQIDVPYDPATNTWSAATDAIVAAHCTSSDCRIVTLYDQSGNGNDITQAITTARPKIYDGATGLVLKRGSLPWATFSGAQYWQRVDVLGLSGSPGFSHWYFVSATNLVSTKVVADIGNKYAAIVASTSDYQNYFGASGGSRVFADSPPSANACSVLHSVGPGAQIQASTVRQDGVDLVESSVTLGTIVPAISGANYTIGALVGGAAWHFTGGGCAWAAFSPDVTGAPRTVLETFGASLKALSV